MLLGEILKNENIAGSYIFLQMQTDVQFHV